MGTQAQRVSKERIDILKYIIFNSKDASPDTKRILFALIEASDSLTKPVYFTSHSKDVAHGIHNMLSCGYHTHLSEFTNLLCEGFHFSHGVRSPKPDRKYDQTIWLAFEFYDSEATEITEEQVNKVKLADPLCKR